MDFDDASQSAPQGPARFMTTLSDQTTKDRRDLAMVIGVSLVAVLAVIVSYLMKAIPQWTDGHVEIALQQVDGISLPPTGSGAVLEPVGTLAATVATEEIPGMATAFLWAADALQAITWCAVITLLGFLALTIMRGRLYSATTMRTMGWFTVGVLAVVVAPLVPRVFGTNYVIGTLDWVGENDVSPDTGAALWPACLVMVFCICMQVALRNGVRLARDQDGIV